MCVTNNGTTRNRLNTRSLSLKLIDLVLHFFRTFMHSTKCHYMSMTALRIYINRIPPPYLYVLTHIRTMLFVIVYIRRHLTCFFGFSYDLSTSFGGDGQNSLIQILNNGKAIIFVSDKSSVQYKCISDQNICFARGKRKSEKANSLSLKL